MYSVKRIILLLSLSWLSACNLTVINEGGGIVRSVSGLIECGQQCEVNSQSLKNNSPQYTEVLTAIADEGYEFAGWEGACTGLLECTVKVTNWSGNKKVTARFIRQQFDAAFAIGNYHACAESEVGLECWGSNDAGQLDVPEGVTKVEALYAGTLHSCAKTDSGLVCWGSDEASIVPDTVQFPSKVALGWYHSCVIENGAVQCWGSNEYGQSTVPEGLVNPTDITAGAHHTCAIVDSGVVCWGAGMVDEGGFPQAGQSIVPEGLVNPTAIGAGNSHTCAIQDGAVVCWGESLWGQLDIPIIEGSIDGFVVGGTHSCVLVNDALQCWGSNQLGQLDVPAGLADISAIGAGNRNLCALAANQLVCWGGNYTGINNVPRSMARPFKIEAGESKVCTLGEDGVHCWGYGSLVPDTLQGVTDFGVGNRHNCYIDDNGLECVGDNNNEQLQVPAAIALSARKVESGYDHNCAIDGTGSVTCWGDDLRGQTTVPDTLGPVSILALGNDNSCALQPTAAVCWGALASQALSNPTVIDIANNHGCAIDDNGVQCWGYTHYGKLNVPALTHPTDVSVGYEHGCALADEGVVCWGAGVEGSTSGMNQYQQSVVPHDHLHNPRDVEAALSYSCALDDVGILCWGYRNFRIITQ